MIKKFVPGAKTRTHLGHWPRSELVAVGAFVFLVFAVLGSALMMVLGVPFFAELPLGVKTTLYLTALAGINCIGYAILVEPYQVRLKTIPLPTEKIVGDVVSVAHLSDLHIRRWSRVEEEVLRLVRESSPDLIVVTGDLSARPCRPPDITRFLKALCEIAPVRLVRGDSERRDPPFLSLTEGTEARWLLDATETLKLRGTSLVLGGVQNGHESKIFELAETIDGQSYSICLYHYPDFFPELAEIPYDLMLCGHTHGGQVRLPIFGALISASRAGTRYARGLFKGGTTTGFVHSGIGCESFGLPRMRFLCPPEVVLFKIGSNKPLP